MSASAVVHAVVYAQQVLSHLMAMARQNVLKIHASIVVLAYLHVLFQLSRNKNQVQLGFFLA